MSKKPKKNKRHFILNAPPFKQDILICLNMTPKEAFRTLKRYQKNPTEKDQDSILKDEWEVGTLGTMYPLSKGILIRVHWEDKKFWRSLGNVLHELTHAVHYILRKVRIPLEENTEEVYTYLLEDLFRQFTLKIMR